MNDLIGQKLGAYQITGEIGHGGMADVYRAHQPSIDRDVAIKMLPAHLMQDRQFLDRFNREVQVIAKLQHPHILSVYDYGEYNGQPYIVMQYVPTGTLADIIIASAKGLPLVEVARLVEQIASALDFAHEKGIVHRDFKPSNVLLDEKKNVYLADFGIAKVIDETAQLTGSGIVGTPSYIAPEMASRGEVTPLVDVYALGITLFQMLTGQLPFQSPTPMAALMAHINDPVPDVTALRADLPPGVQAVVSRALAKDPFKRYQTAGELAAALQKVVETAAETEPSEPPLHTLESPVFNRPPTAREEQPTQRRRKTVPWIAVGVGLGALVICAGLIIGGMVLSKALGGKPAATPEQDAAKTVEPTRTADATAAHTGKQTLTVPTEIVPTENVPPPTINSEPQAIDLVLGDLSTYTTSTGAVYFIGEITNTGNVGLVYVKLTIILRDQANNLLTTETGYVDLTVLEPGQTAPISVLFADGVPDYHHYEFTLQGDPATYLHSYNDFEIIADNGHIGSLSGYQIEGEVRNTGDHAAEFVKVVASLYNSDGVIIGTSFTYVSADILQPGESSTFDLTVYSVPAESIDSYTLIVQGSEVN
ncbi:MAG: protein kinase [Anaerolineae bacterium]|nr:protein kinase [Anaerolineae bacterium]